jgi:hypothetical protein
MSGSVSRPEPGPVRVEGLGIDLSDLVESSFRRIEAAGRLLERIRDELDIGLVFLVGLVGLSFEAGATTDGFLARHRIHDGTPERTPADLPWMPGGILELEPDTPLKRAIPETALDN